MNYVFIMKFAQRSLKPLSDNKMENNNYETRHQTPVYRHRYGAIQPARLGAKL